MPREDFFMNKKEIIEALKAKDFTPYYEEADRIRKQYKGDEVLIRSISNLVATAL